MLIFHFFGNLFFHMVNAIVIAASFRRKDLRGKFFIQQVKDIKRKVKLMHKNR